MCASPTPALALRRRLTRIDASHPAARRAINLWLRLSREPDEPDVQARARDLLNLVELRARLVALAERATSRGELALAAAARGHVVDADADLLGAAPSGWQAAALELLDQADSDDPGAASGPGPSAGGG